LRMKAESSMMSTRMRFSAIRTPLGCSGGLFLAASWSDEILNCGEQHFFLHRLREEVARAFLNGTVFVLSTSARGDDHDGHVFHFGNLAHVRHELIAIDAGHL